MTTHRPREFGGLLLVPCVLLGACVPRPELVEVMDLVREFPYAETRSERPMLDLGTGAAVSSLVAGWSWNETDPQGTTFAWAVGGRSELKVYLASPRDLEVRMRCRAFPYPGAPPQRLEALWDDRETAVVEIGAGFSERTFTVPAALATAGDHRLSLVPAYFGRPATDAVSGASVPKHRRKPSFACDWIKVGDSPEPGPARGEGGTLWIPAASEVAFYTETSDDLELRWEGVSVRGASVLEVVWEVEGVGPESTSVAGVLGGSLPLLVPRRDKTSKDALPAKLTLRAGASVKALGAEGSADSEGVGVALRGARVMAEEFAIAGTAHVAASGRAGDMRAAPLPQRVEGPPESILLWIVDTLRVDRLGLYGHDRPVSPNYDALASQSTVFDRAVAQSSWTRPTVASLLTGVGPKRHGISDVTHYLDDSFATPGRPFFLTILSIEPHGAFRPAEPFRGRFASDVDDPWLGTAEHLRALADRKAPATDEVVEKLFRLYDGEIAWNDHMFGEFRRELKQRGMDPLVVVVADHGEAFKERGVFGHAWDLHREVLDIPFLIHRPGQLEGRRVRVPVQQVDLLPTLLEIVRGAPALDVEGDSLMPLLVPESPAGDANTMRPVNQRLLVSTTDRFRRPFASLIRGRYKLIEPLRGGDMPDRQLFDWLADPEEGHDLAAERPLFAGVLARLLREQLDLAALDSVEAVEVELDEETRRRLEALGYIE